jgi:hypothetical protein
MLKIARDQYQLHDQEDDYANLYKKLRLRHANLKWHIHKSLNNMLIHNELQKHNGTT